MARTKAMKKQSKARNANKLDDIQINLDMTFNRTLYIIDLIIEYEVQHYGKSYWKKKTIKNLTTHIEQKQD